MAYRGRRRRKIRFVHVEGQVLFRRPKSILFSDGNGTHWLPRKHVTEYETAEGNPAVCMPEWLAKEKKYA